MNGTIVTLGGGGFSDAHRDSAIDDFLLDLTGASRPKVCFVPTASGDADGYSQRFEEAFAGRATTSVLSLFCHNPWGYLDPEMLLDQHLIYVGGGSTANLLAVWRLHGLPDILWRATEHGTVLAGISAGMNCWFEQSSTDSFGPLAPMDDGLGFLPGSACPHNLGESERRDQYLGWVASGALKDGWAVDDHTALVFRDGEFLEAIGEQDGHPAFRVERRDDEALETALDVRLLR